MWGAKFMLAAVKPYYNRSTLQHYKIYIMLLVVEVFQRATGYLSMHSIPWLIVASIPYFLSLTFIHFFFNVY